MSHVVLKFNKKSISEIKEHYKAHISPCTPQYAIFSAKKNGVTITAYTSGKVMFQGSNSETEANIWKNKAETENSSNNVSSVSIHEFMPPEEINNLSIIGSDEAGTGDFFGPVTVASALVTPNDIPWLKELGVADSKKLTDKHILRIAGEITERIPFSLISLNNTKYNEVQSKGMTQGKMKAMLHEQAIQNLLKKISPIKADGVLIDQFCEPGVYFRHTKTSGKREIPIYFRTKAESFSVAVATASIISRAAYVKHMDLISEKLGKEVPKGAGSTVDKFAACKISEIGIDGLKPYIKYHFANTEKAMKIARGIARSN